VSHGLFNYFSANLHTVVNGVLLSLSSVKEIGYVVHERGEELPAGCCILTSPKATILMMLHGSMMLHGFMDGQSFL